MLCSFCKSLNFNRSVISLFKSNAENNVKAASLGNTFNQFNWKSRHCRLFPLPSLMRPKLLVSMRLDLPISMSPELPILMRPEVLLCMNLTNVIRSSPQAFNFTALNILLKLCKLYMGSTEVNKFAAHPNLKK